MGCFSYLCKVCNEPINFDCDKDIGEHCTLYLLENGRIIEEMTGEYNSYGCVYKDKELKYPDRYAKWESYDWSEICDLNFTPAKNCGIAAVHTDCHPLNPYKPFSDVLKTRSDGDENQGNAETRHITKGRFSQRLIEKPKTKTPDIPRNANDHLWDKIHDGMEELDILFAELREKLDKDNENIK